MTKDQALRFNEIIQFIKQRADNQAQAQTYIVALKAICGVR